MNIVFLTFQECNNLMYFFGHIFGSCIVRKFQQFLDCSDIDCFVLYPIGPYEQVSQLLSPESMIMDQSMQQNMQGIVLLMLSPPVESSKSFDNMEGSLTICLTSLQVFSLAFGCWLQSEVFVKCVFLFIYFFFANIVVKAWGKNLT